MDQNIIIIIIYICCNLYIKITCNLQARPPSSESPMAYGMRMRNGLQEIAMSDLCYLRWRFTRVVLLSNSRHGCLELTTCHHYPRFQQTVNKTSDYCQSCTLSRWSYSNFILFRSIICCYLIQLHQTFSLFVSSKIKKRGKIQFNLTRVELLHTRDVHQPLNLVFFFLLHLAATLFYDVIYKF